MSYAAASDVAMYTPGLLDDGRFTDTSVPSKDTVEQFLSSGCSVIEGRLAAAGYSTPVPGGAAVYDQVKDLETLFAAARAEMTRMTARVTAQERTRGQVFQQMFDDGLKALLAQDLSRAGLTHTGRLYAGGISESDKETVEADTDRVEPRFSRGQFRHKGTDRPGDATNDLTD